MKKIILGSLIFGTLVGYAVKKSLDKFISDIDKEAEKMKKDFDINENETIYNQEENVVDFNDIVSSDFDKKID